MNPIKLLSRKKQDDLQPVLGIAGLLVDFDLAFEIPLELPI